MTGARDEPTWSTARRILAVRLDAMGDVLMTTPALRAVRAARPDAHIALLTSSAGATVGPLLPDVDETLAWDAPWMKVAGADDHGARTRAFLGELAAAAFDAAIVFTVYTQSALPAALAAYVAGIPLRLAHSRENPYRLLTHWVPEPETAGPTRHEVRRQLDLVASVGYQAVDTHLSVRVPPDAARRVRARLAVLGLRDGRPWAVVHPGASAPSRRYPPESYATALDALVRDHGWRVVLTGGRDEVGLVETVRGHMTEPAISLAGELSVAELAALLAVAPLLISNNTGPVHLAAAVATPVVVLYALTNLQHTPWGVQARVLSHDVPCRGCLKSVCPLGHNACLRSVGPGAIVEAALDLQPARTVALAGTSEMAGATSGAPAEGSPSPP